VCGGQNLGGWRVVEVRQPEASSYDHHVL
jgi:hypothetical protein